MTMTKEALDLLFQQYDDEYIINEDGPNYIKNHYKEMEEYSVKPLKTHTLQSVVNFVKGKEGHSIVIHIVTPTEIQVYSRLNEYKRDNYMSATAFTNNVEFGRYMDLESFNLMIQTNFTDTEDKAKVLAYVGNIKDEKVNTYSDDGVSQSVTVKKGVATVGEAILPNPVSLAPYRTFPEIEQPMSKFIFRMKDGPVALLEEADGNLWKIEAIENIRKFLINELDHELENIQIYG